DIPSCSESSLRVGVGSGPIGYLQRIIGLESQILALAKMVFEGKTFNSSEIEVAVSSVSADGRGQIEIRPLLDHIPQFFVECIDFYSRERADQLLESHLIIDRFFRTQVSIIDRTIGVVIPIFKIVPAQWGSIPVAGRALDQHVIVGEKIGFI